MTSVSNIVFYALSSGTLGFALHGSSVNHFLIGGNSSTANQILSCKWLLKLPTIESKTEGTTWKSIKNYIRNWCQKWCCILFGAIYRENNQWNKQSLKNRSLYQGLQKARFAHYKILVSPVDLIMCLNKIPRWFSLRFFSLIFIC